MARKGIGPTHLPGNRHKRGAHHARAETTNDHWIKESVDSGVLPAHEIGALAFGDCENAPGTQFQEKTVLKFEAVDLPLPQLYDYYPFGAPTAGRISVNDRPYWNIWMPRGNPE